MSNDQTGRSRLADRTSGVLGRLRRLPLLDGATVVIALLSVTTLVLALTGYGLPFLNISPSADGQATFPGIDPEMSQKLDGDDAGEPVKSDLLRIVASIIAASSDDAPYPTSVPSEGSPQATGIKIVYEGIVESVSDSAAVIGGLTVIIDASTRLDNFQGVPLTADQYVEVRGEIQTDVSILATGIDLKAASPPPGQPTPRVRLEFGGAVDSVSGSTAIIDSITVIIDTNTRFGDFQGRPLTVGQYVRVLGALQAGGSVLATGIDLKPTSPPPGQPTPRVGMEFEGTVESVSGPTAIIDGITVVIGANTSFGGFDGRPLTAGQHISVHGWLQADGSVLATELQLKTASSPPTSPTPTTSPPAPPPPPPPSASPSPSAPPPPPPPPPPPTPSPTATPTSTPAVVAETEFLGTVTSASGVTAIINGLTVVTDEDTNFSGFEGQPLAAGQYVHVHGWLRTDGSVLATEIELK